MQIGLRANSKLLRVVHGLLFISDYALVVGTMNHTFASTCCKPPFSPSAKLPAITWSPFASTTLSPKAAAISSSVRCLVCSNVSTGEEQLESKVLLQDSTGR